MTNQFDGFFSRIDDRCLTPTTDRCLLVPQRFDGIQIRGLFCRIETEKDADGAGVSRRTDDGPTEETSQGKKGPSRKPRGSLNFLLSPLAVQERLCRVEDWRGIS
jgi:hypothetical protein